MTLILWLPLCGAASLVGFVAQFLKRVSMRLSREAREAPDLKCAKIERGFLNRFEGFHMFRTEYYRSAFPVVVHDWSARNLSCGCFVGLSCFSILAFPTRQEGRI